MSQRASAPRHGARGWNTPRRSQRQGFAVDAHRPILEGTDQILGGIFQGVQVAAVVPAKLAGGGVPMIVRISE